MKSFLIILFFSFGLMNLPVHGLEKGQEGSAVLTLEEFVERAIKNDTEFEEILIRELTLKYQEDLKIPARDLVLSVKEEFSSYLKRDEKDAQTQVSLSKLFPLSGTELAASYALTPQAKTDHTSSELELSISQPIARNAFGKSTRLLKKIVGLEVEVARHQIIEAYEDYMAALLTAYLNWVEAYENLRIGSSSYEQNVKLLDNIEARKKSRIALPIDVNKVTLQVLAKKETLVTLEQRYGKSLNFVKRALRSKDSKILIPEIPEDLGFLEDSFQIAFKSFWDSSRTRKVLDLLEKKSELEMDIEANDLLPSLSVSAGYLRKGEKFKIEKPDDKLFFNVVLDWPFPDQVDRAEKEIARIDLRKRKLTTQNTQYQLFASLRDLFLELEREKQLKDIANQKIKLATSILEGETENYTFGKVTLNDYISSVNVLDNNMFNLIFREVEWKRLLIEWLRLTDGLVFKNQIQDKHPEYFKR